MRQKLNRKILVTGGMGFIGPAIIQRLVKTDRVTVADRLDFGMAPQVKPLMEEGSVEFIETDLADPSPLYKRIAGGEFDVIVHLAAFAFIPLCEAYPDFAYMSNVIPSLNILSRLPATCRLIIFSTSSTYAPEMKFHEEAKSELHPIDVYGWSKKHVEDMAHFYASKNNLNVLIIRLANAAGYGETTPHVLETIIDQVRSGGNVVELGNLSPKRDYIHIDDVAWVVDQLSQRWPVGPGHVEIFNLGTGYDPISVKELFEKVVACTGRKVQLKSVSERQRKEDRELLCVDSRKIFEVLPDYKPRPIDEWLPELVKNPGFRSRPVWEQIIKKCYEKKAS